MDRVKGIIENIIRRRFGGDDKQTDGTTTPPDAVPTMPFNVLLDCVVAVLKDGQLTHADLEPTVLACEELFETYVRPFDIPKLGPVVERVVDDMLLASIRPTLTKLFDRFVRV